MTKNSQPIARLIWQTENGQQELILRQEDVVTIGRGETSTIVINSARVSRNHARIEWNGDNFTIRDMSSSNGTFVNGQRVEYMPWGLRDGDIILLERIPMHFEEISIQRAEQDVNTLPTVPMGKQGKDASRPRLIITEGPDAGREVGIGEEGLTIGRASQSATWALRLKDGTVSRPHAQIEYHNGVYSLMDLGSANGTTLNDLFVIAPVIISDGDVIGMGSTRLIFKIK